MSLVYAENAMTLPDRSGGRNAPSLA